MVNRKVLYGYQVQDGSLKIVPSEQQTVNRVFALYNAGTSYQGISDILNHEGTPYSLEVPHWNKNKVKRLLENPRYIGADGYPMVVDANVYWAVHQRIAEKSAKNRLCGEKENISKFTPYLCCVCGNRLNRLRRKTGAHWRKVAERHNAVPEVRSLRKLHHDGDNGNGGRDRPAVPHP